MKTLPPSHVGRTTAQIIEEQSHFDSIDRLYRPVSWLDLFARSRSWPTLLYSCKTLPLHLFGAGGYGLRQGLLMMPARLLQAAAPFVFDLLLTRFGTAALSVTAAFGVASFVALAFLREQASVRGN
jgi:hypothetical protein